MVTQDSQSDIYSIKQQTTTPNVGKYLNDVTKNINNTKNHTPINNNNTQHIFLVRKVI